jgi:hypothetical protein
MLHANYPPTQVDRRDLAVSRKVEDIEVHFVCRM